MSGAVRVADYVMSALADAGVRHVFLLPGGGAMHLVDALGCNRSLESVPQHHEQACAIAAEAYGRITENIGVALVTTGPGATNALTAVAGAWIESTPLLVISGQVKRSDRIGDKGVRQMGVQEVDIVRMVEGVTKYAVTVTEPQAIRRHLEEALYLARHGRQGPVWLDIPLDVQAAMVHPDELPPWNGDRDSPPAVQDDALAELLRLLGDAQRPLLLAGHGIRLAGAAAAFQPLVERLGIPVVTTWNALDLLPHEHPLNVGKPGVVALRAPNLAIQNCDLLLAVGCRLDNVITAYKPRNFARAATKVVVDIDAAELAKLDMAPLTPIRADAGAFVRALDAAWGKQPPGDWTAWRARCRDWKTRYRVLEGGTFPATGPVSHYHLAEALSDEFPAGATVATGSSGLGVEAFYTVFRNRPGQRVFLTSGLGAMGYGLPAAIGACLARGRARTLLVESDGSLQLNLQELATVVGQKLPITMFVMNNGGYASIRNTQRNYFAGRYVGTGPEAGLHLPDLAALAAAYGIPFLRIDDAGRLHEGIGSALATPGPSICEVVLIPDETLWPKVAAIPQADGGMLSMPMEDMSPLLPLPQLEAEMLVPLTPASIRARQ